MSCLFCQQAKFKTSSIFFYRYSATQRSNSLTKLGVFVTMIMHNVRDFAKMELIIMVMYPDLSFAEKQAYFSAKEFSGKDAELLNSILDECIKLVKSNSLGEAILKGAGYEEKTSIDRFTVEKIYIGNRGKVRGGHCGLISAIDNDENKKNARGEIYINEDFVRKIRSELGEKNSVIYLSNIVIHEFLHGNQRRCKGIENKVENSRSGLVNPKTEETKKSLTAENQQKIYNDIQENKEGYARMILTEAASMAAGLTVSLQLCNIENKDAIVKYALNDIKSMANVSENTIPSLTEKFKEHPYTKEEQQNFSLSLFRILVKGEMEYLSKISGNKPLNIQLNDYGDLLNTTFNKDLFGSRADFDQTIALVDAQNRVLKNIKQNQSKLETAESKIAKIGENRRSLLTSVQTRKEYQNCL